MAARRVKKIRKTNPMRVEVALARSVVIIDTEYETRSEEREPVSLRGQIDTENPALIAGNG